MSIRKDSSDTQSISYKRTVAPMIERGSKGSWAQIWTPGRRECGEVARNGNRGRVKRRIGLRCFKEQWVLEEEGRKYRCRSFVVVLSISSSFLFLLSVPFKITNQQT